MEELVLTSGNLNLTVIGVLLSMIVFSQLHYRQRKRGHRKWAWRWLNLETIGIIFVILIQFLLTLASPTLFEILFLIMCIWLFVFTLNQRENFRKQEYTQFLQGVINSGIKVAQAMMENKENEEKEDEV